MIQGKEKERLWPKETTQDRPATICLRFNISTMNSKKAYRLPLFENNKNEFCVNSCFVHDLLDFAPENMQLLPLKTGNAKVLLAKGRSITPLTSLKIGVKLFHSNWLCLGSLFFWVRWHYLT